MQERPEYVEVRFNEIMTISESATQLFDSSGTARALSVVSNDGLDGGSIVRWATPADLSEGWYAVNWRAVSGDGHPVSGTFTFYYGDPEAAADQQKAEVSSDPARPYVLASHVLRVLAYLAALLGVGFLVVIWAVSGNGDVAGMTAFLRRGATAAAIVGLVATPLAIVNTALILNGGSLEYLRTIVQIVMQSDVGSALLVRMSALFGVCTAVLLLAERKTRLVGAVIAAGSAVALAYSFARGGHAAVVPWTIAASAGEVLHLLGASIWLGGIPAVAWFARRRSDISDEMRLHMIDRFSRLATIGVICVGIGGGVLGASMLTSPADLVTTRYGVYLIVKVLLVAGVGIIGVYNHFSLVPSLRADKSGGARNRLRTALTAETVLLALVLTATGVLTTDAAPAAGGDHLSHIGGDSHGHGGGFDPSLSIALDDLTPKIVRAQMGDGELQVDYLPGRVNAENRFRVSVADATGSERDLEKVTLSFVQPTLGIGPIERVLTADEFGSWVLATRDIGTAGDWDVTVLVRFADGTVDQAVVQVVIQASVEGES